MVCKLIQVADNFYNIRGSFKIGGVIDIGTQCSLVKLASGGFVFLDAYNLTEEVADEIAALTNNANIDAIINLHPFHTVYVQAMQQRYPQAKLYGTARHVEKFPELAWEKELTETTGFQALYRDDFDFSVPAGIDFIPANENLHFSSVLAYHGDSKTIHVDDTLMNIHLPLPLRLLGKSDALGFHPTLGKTLERRAGAANDFRIWAAQLASNWQAAENLCAAHTSLMLGKDNTGATIEQRILRALQKVEKTLAAHERKYG